MIEPMTPGPTSRVTNTRNNKPLVFEALKAYRHWDIKGGQLAAPHHGSFIWKPGENIALCERTGHTAVECANSARYTNCGCGFYCVWDDTNQYAMHTNLMRSTVFGVIEIYGAVTIGGDGARAAKAKIVALHIPPNVWTPFNRGRLSVHPLMESYLGVRFYKERANLIAAEGVQRPDTLLNKSDVYGSWR